MMSTMTAATLCECFARDGLQHEPEFVATATKRALIERFAALGFRRVVGGRVSETTNHPQRDRPLRSALESLSCLLTGKTVTDAIDSFPAAE